MSEGPETPLKLDEWLGALRAAIGRADAAGVVDRATERALLDLTRVAAHRSERIAAPITAYVVGLAAASIPEVERAAWIAALAERLEAPVGD